MAVFKISKSRAETPSAPAIAVMVTLGALYRVAAFPPTGALPMDADDVVDRLPEPSALILAKTALSDAAPFARQAVHTASATVDPLHPLFITGFGLADHPIFPLDLESSTPED